MGYVDRVVISFTREDEYVIAYQPPGATLAAHAMGKASDVD